MTENLLGLEHAGDLANEALSKLGLDKADAMIGEGFCPICQNRGSATPVIDDEPDTDEGRLKHHALVNCTTCNVRWRSGPNGGMPGPLPWIEHARQVKDGMIFAMLLNGPPDLPYLPAEDEWWDGEDLDD